MIKHILKRILIITTGVTSMAFAVIPESLFCITKTCEKASQEFNILVNRTLFFVAVALIAAFCVFLHVQFRSSILIKGKNYRIKISYGNILEVKNAKKVIPFDECYSTSVGESPAEIKPFSICGQYIIKFGESEIKNVINKSSIKPASKRSHYNNQHCYAPGTIIPNGEYLFLAFAKLDSNGLGYMKYEEYLDCLNLLWKEIDKYYAQHNVCIPILGSGITRFNDIELTQQELLDTIIQSYKLSRHKLKLPTELHIVCKKSDGFSLNNIEK